MANPVILGKTAMAEQAAFGTAETSLTVLETGIVTPVTSRQMFAAETLRGTFYQPRPVEGSQAGQTLEIPLPFLHGVSSTTPAANPTAHPLSWLLKSVMGGRTTAAGYGSSAVSTGSDTDTVKIKSATSVAGYVSGSGLIVTDGTSYEMGWIEAVTDGSGSDHTVELAQALGLTPAENSSTFGTVTCFLNQDSPTFLTVAAQSLRSDSRIVHEGVVVQTVEITLDPRGVPQASVSCQIHSAAASSTALDNYAYTLPRIPVASRRNGARFSIDGTAVAVHSLSIRIEQTVIPLHDHNGTEGLGGWAVANRMVTITAVRRVAAAAPLLALGSNAVITGQFGSQPGNIMGFFAGSAVPDGPGEMSEVDGGWAQTYTWKQGQYTGDSGSGNAVDSPFKIAFG